MVNFAPATVEEAPSYAKFDDYVLAAIDWALAPEVATHWKLTRYPHGVYISEWEQNEGLQLVDNWPAPSFDVELPIDGVTAEQVVYRVQRPYTS